MEKNDFVRFNFKGAAIRAIAEKVVVDLVLILGEEKIPCRLNVVGTEVRVHIKKIGIVFIECNTLDPYFYCPFPKIVRLAEISSSLRRQEFLTLLEKAAAD